MRFRLEKRLLWVLGQVCTAMAAYGVSGAVIGAAIGYFNWTQTSSHAVGDSMAATMRFCLMANAIWSAILALLITFPLFLLLFRTLAPQRGKPSHREVFFAMTLPCAALQILGPLLVGTLYFAVPDLEKRFQLLFPNRNTGDLIAWTQMITLLGGSCLGAAILSLIWRGAGAGSGTSRLLPIE